MVSVVRKVGEGLARDGERPATRDGLAVRSVAALCALCALCAISSLGSVSSFRSLYTLGSFRPIAALRTFCPLGSVAALSPIRVFAASSSAASAPTTAPLSIGGGRVVDAIAIRLAVVDVIATGLAVVDGAVPTSLEPVRPDIVRSVDARTAVGGRRGRADCSEGEQRKSDHSKNYCSKWSDFHDLFSSSPIRS